ncbi:phage tail sheath subtilisin-like domain-containing protein [Sphingomonas psychrotolerans]|uniref:Phage tail sheath subtilisin-like domain-containing protein n=1 Tax=Sphingomonas psychrotolerans TaxID=1327635 RepID=A0ABU3N9S4_9SPHN|nr:phage tail sheath subtilisin-like domain-containing protein [Sphingomonas psychrotolerans]MDT8760261.1 phage tail sheath subtilisin-like domain-containing protein [Sphingomonas psychrotolerans]
MPEYLAPAVFVEETSFRAKSIEGVGTSTCAFVGMTARGPVSRDPSDPTPPLLTSFADYERYYGGVDDLTIGGAPARNYLALAAQAFFNNGGGRLYVARILGAAAAAAAGVVLNSGSPAVAKKLTLSARTAAGARIAGSDTNFRVTIAENALPTTKKLALKQPAGTLVLVGTDVFVVGTADVIAATDEACSILSYSVLVEDPTGPVYEAGGLGVHPKHPRFINAVLGTKPASASDALTNPIILDVGSGATAAEARAALMNTAVGGVRVVPLTGGSDGTGGPSAADYATALDSLLALEDVSIVAAPGASSFAAPLPAAVNQSLIGHAEARRAYRIAVLDTPPGLEVTADPSVKTLKSLIDSKYAALYYPWITIANPLAATDPAQPSLVDVPPSGAVCGIYARNDVQRGVWKAPANETVTGALALQRDVRFGEQEVLNPLGINCIRALSGRGIRVWGARTISSDPEWKYVNIRRYFLYLEASIDRGTQWAVFEPNGEALWANVRTTVSDFLYNEWVSGALLGASPKEAFFVRCDRTTMTQNDLDNGRLICLVGVAAIKPAEFVIFRIGQKTADARG